MSEGQCKNEKMAVQKNNEMCCSATLGLIQMKKPFITLDENGMAKLLPSVRDGHPKVWKGNLILEWASSLEKGYPTFEWLPAV